MKPLDRRVDELERDVKQLLREAARKPAREANPLAPEHGRWIGITAAEDNGDGTIDVTVHLYSLGDAEWQETTLVLEDVRPFDEETPIPVSAKVLVIRYENCWVLIPLEAAIVDIVEVYHSSATNGDVVAANADGYHPGRIRSPNGTDTYTVGADIWIQFVDGFDGQPDDDGAIFAVHGEYYGPAKQAGTWDKVENEGMEGETHDVRPLYIVECSEREFLAKADSAVSKGSSGTFSIYHSYNQTDSTLNMTALALAGAIATDKWVILSRVAGVWFATQWEC